MAEHNYYIADEVRREMACLPQCFVILQYIDGHFDLVLATDRVYSLLGISKEMLRERYRNHFWQFFHPDDMPALRSKLREIFGHLDTVYPFRVRVKVRESYRWLRGNMQGRRLEDGTLLLYAAMMDVTEDHDRHQREKRNDLLMSRVLDTTPNCMFWKDTHRRFVGVNQAFLDFYGFPSEDVLIGKTDEDMGWHEDPEPFRQDELRVLQGHSTHMVHGTCLVHGETRDILATKAPVYDGDRIIGLVGSFIDATDRYERERKIEKLSKDLEKSLNQEKQLNAVMNKFLSRLSHELRTPMNAVIGLSALGLEQDTVAGARTYLDKIQTSGKYLLRIINEVLEINKIESGDYQLYPEETSVGDIYDAVAVIIRPLADSKQIELVLDRSGIEEDCGRVFCDKIRVQQILINLLNNAVKFTNPGGRVSLSASVLPAAPGEIPLTVFTVTDTGCGIHPDFMPRLFSPFAQENRDPSKYGIGTGLGLTICDTFAKMMGGSIEVDSTIDVGTTFRVSLPLPPCGSTEMNDSAPNITADKPDYSSLQGLCVLIAEDNLINQEVIQGMLNRVGITADIAPNGKRALEMFSASSPGFYSTILMDIQMPFMNGFDTARAIRALDRGDARTVPIIAMSADIFEDSRKKASECGMTAYVSKPLDMDHLYETLQKEIRSI